MARESTQHKLDRVRPPRVQITYDVETGGAIEVKELPFVMGVLSDFTGQQLGGQTFELVAIHRSSSLSRPCQAFDGW